jgi:hypothetical protein
MTQQEKSSSTEQINTRYLFVQKEGVDHTYIKLVEEKYLNIIYKYGKVQFAKEPKEDGTLPMRFEYEIIKNPNAIEFNEQEFINYIGDILVELLEKQLTDGKVVFK